MISGGPNVLFLGVGRLVLGHHARQSMGRVGLLQPGNFLVCHLQIGGFCRAVDVMEFGSPHHRGRRLREQPGKGDFGPGYAALSRQCVGLDGLPGNAIGNADVPSFLPRASFPVSVLN